MKKRLNIPKFKNQDEEFDYFSSLNIAEYFDRSDGKKVIFPNLKPTSQKISMRIPKFLLLKVKEKANALDLPYQALIRKFIADSLTSKNI